MPNLYLLSSVQSALLRPLYASSPDMYSALGCIMAAVQTSTIKNSVNHSAIYERGHCGGGITRGLPSKHAGEALGLHRLAVARSIWPGIAEGRGHSGSISRQRPASEGSTAPAAAVLSRDHDRARVGFGKLTSKTHMQKPQRKPAGKLLRKNKTRAEKIISNQQPSESLALSTCAVGGS